MDFESEIRAARHRLYAELSTLSDDEWQSPSGCDGWTIHELAAHLVIATEASVARVGKLMLSNFMNFNRAMDRGARKLASECSPPELLEQLRSLADRVNPPPVLGIRSPLWDITMHSFDACAPIGREVEVSAAVVPHCLDFVMTRPLRATLPVQIRPGVRLVASDIDWAWGPPDGHLIEGPGLALLLYLSGRNGALISPELESPVL